MLNSEQLCKSKFVLEFGFGMIVIICLNDYKLINNQCLSIIDKQKMNYYNALGELDSSQPI